MTVLSILTSSFLSTPASTCALRSSSCSLMCANAKPDPTHAGRFLPNGQAAKRGLNHSLRAAALGGLASKLEYKTKAAAHSRLVLVNPAYTSQTCSKCGHCAKENRESQAVFLCKQCHARMNADVNAAINILNRGVEHALGLDEAEHAETIQDTRTVQHGKSAIVACKTSTRH